MCPTQSFGERNGTRWVSEAPGSEAGERSCYLPGLGGVVWGNFVWVGQRSLNISLVRAPLPACSASSKRGKADVRLWKDLETCARRQCRKRGIIRTFGARGHLESLRIVVQSQLYHYPVL